MGQYIDSAALLDWADQQEASHIEAIVSRSAGIEETQHHRGAIRALRAVRDEIGRMTGDVRSPERKPGPNPYA